MYRTIKQDKRGGTYSDFVRVFPLCNSVVSPKAHGLVMITKLGQLPLNDIVSTWAEKERTDGLGG